MNRRYGRFRPNHGLSDAHVIVWHPHPGRDFALVPPPPRGDAIHVEPLSSPHFFSFFCITTQAPGQKKIRAPAPGGGRGGAGANILQFYSDDSPGFQVGPTTVLVASLSFVGIVVLLHIIGKFRS